MQAHARPSANDSNKLYMNLFPKSFVNQQQQLRIWVPWQLFKLLHAAQ
jgi:hypothetical protein